MCNLEKIDPTDAMTWWQMLHSSPLSCQLPGVNLVPIGIVFRDRVWRAAAYIAASLSLDSIFDTAPHSVRVYPFDWQRQLLAQN